MKIRSLSLKNINSLAGIHNIDFTHPRFTNEGLFAITGKTGAGKSTILDAISLALYGKTARLGLISGNENNLMTKGATDCFSEIVFSVSDKTWKASWKQERSKNGKLKPIHRIIADDNNQIVADQVRTCDQAIADILGLTFEQFTKVILLAQGSFAAFLQANKNEKGELLEQITGTEIYAEISVAVHNKVKQESDKLSLIETELNAINVLSEEEEAALLDDFTTAQSKKNEFDNAIESLQTALNWLERIDLLKQQNQERDQHLPTLVMTASNAANRLNELKIEFENLLKYQQTQTVVFRRVRELDTKIQEKNVVLFPVQQTLAKLHETHSTLSANLIENQDKRAAVSSEMALIETWFDEHKQLASLLTEKSAIESENNRLMLLMEEVNNSRKEVDGLVKKLQTAKEDALLAETQWKEAVDRFDSKADLLEKTKKEQSALLNGKTIVELVNEKSGLVQQLTMINPLMVLHADIEASRTIIRTLENNSASTIKELEQRMYTLEKNKRAQLELAEKIRLLEENILLGNAIRDLHEHRQQLKDGEACPLCGALEHPFGNGNIPVINDNQRTLEKAKKESAALSEAIVSVEKEITRLTTLREQAAEQNTTETEKLKAAKNKFNKELQRLAVAFPALITADECEIILSLETIENETKIKLATFDQLIQTVNESQKTIESIRDFELLKADREKQTAQLSHFNAENEVTIQANLLTTKKQALDSLAATLANNMSSLQSTFEAFGVSNIEALRDCFTSWNENKTRLDSLSEEKKKLESSIRVNEVQRNGQQEMIDKTTKDVESLEQVLLSLTNERTSVFGQKIVEEEETALMAAVRNMDMSKKAAEIELNNANNEVENIKSIIAANSKELKQLTQKQITDKSREELSALYAEKKRVLNELLQQIGANTERRRASDESRKQAGQKLIEKQTQQAIVNKWAQLNDLIGSATGIKFRNFAQALTFEHLVSVSNTQLQKMSDRYLLQRTDDHTNPFELSVIDKYQNNEIRTAQNLSGGEKFIVSLSLALGLANMAGKNMRIDTMFIDEGFGTLDPEYLDVALNALSSLQHEGKIIGVISHLSELKERISTHIEVISTGNGHSTIQPGF